MIFFESSSRSIFLLEHDLRANASRLSRGKTGTHPASSAGQAFSGSCCNELTRTMQGSQASVSVASADAFCVTIRKGDDEEYQCPVASVPVGRGDAKRT